MEYLRKYHYWCSECSGYITVPKLVHLKDKHSEQFFEHQSSASKINHKKNYTMFVELGRKLGVIGKENFRRYLEENPEKHRQNCSNNGKKTISIATQYLRDHPEEKSRTSRKNGNKAKDSFVTCSLGCGLKYIFKFYLEHLKQFHIEEFLKHQKSAGHFGGLIGGSKITSDNVINARKELLRIKLQKPEYYREIKARGGSASAKKQALDGTIFLNLNKRKGQYVIHDDHYHRSKPEKNYCIELQELYDLGLLHSNIHYKGIELDWIVGSDRKNPETWLRVIEYHQVRYWEGDTEEGYKQIRFQKIRERGITCPVEFIITK